MNLPIDLCIMLLLLMLRLLHVESNEQLLVWVIKGLSIQLLDGFMSNIIA